MMGVSRRVVALRCPPARRINARNLVQMDDCYVSRPACPRFDDRCQQSWHIHSKPHVRV